MNKKSERSWVLWLSPVASLVATIARVPAAIGGIAPGAFSALGESLAWVALAVVGFAPMVRWCYGKLPSTRLRECAQEIRETRDLITRSPQDYKHPTVDTGNRVGAITEEVRRIVHGKSLPKDVQSRHRLLLDLLIPVEKGRVKETRQAIQRFTED